MAWALTTKEADFLEDPKDGFAPNLCLAAPTEEVKEDETSAWVAILGFVSKEEKKREERLWKWVIGGVMMWEEGIWTIKWKWERIR